MLLLENITGASMDRDEWIKSRIGRFTSSENHLLMSPQKLSQAGINYIYRKVGEKTSERPCRELMLSISSCVNSIFPFIFFDKSDSGTRMLNDNQRWVLPSRASFTCSCIVFFSFCTIVDFVIWKRKYKTFSY